MAKRKQPEIDDQIIIYEKTGTYVVKETNKVASYKYYQACWEVPKASLPEGASRRRLTASGRSRAKATADLREKVYEFLASPDSHWNTARTRGATLNRYVERWIKEDLRLDAISETVKRRHIENYRHHIAPFLGDKNIRNISHLEINRLLTHSLLIPRDVPSKIYSGGVRPDVVLSSATRKNVRSTLSKIFSTATEDGVISKNPMKRVPKVEVEPKNKDNMDEAIRDVKKFMRWMKKNAHVDYCRFLLQLLGLRRAERLGLTWDNIHGLDTSSPTIVISQQLARYESTEYDYSLRSKASRDLTGWYIKKWTKTKKIRKIPLQGGFVTELRAHKKAWEANKKSWEPIRQKQIKAHKEWVANKRKGDETIVVPPIGMENLVFLKPDGNLITLNRDNEDWRMYLDLAGVKGWRGHLNRHITATIFANAKNPPSVQVMKEMLGHETTAMSEYYARVLDRNVADAVGSYIEELDFI